MHCWSQDVGRSGLRAEVTISASVDSCQLLSCKLAAQTLYQQHNVFCSLSNASKANDDHHGCHEPLGDCLIDAGLCSCPCLDSKQVLRAMKTHPLLAIHESASFFP